jgi:ubiquinone/menaquinone biosynthesis C-methylase UbiE
MSDLKAVYKRRFAGEMSTRNNIWKVLCANFFQKYISEGDTVLDVAGGYCVFINNIKCFKKIVVDLNEDVRSFAKEDVNTVVAASMDMKQIADNSVDVVFVSNFFEHLTRADIEKTLGEIKRVLKPGGRFLNLFPNIRYCYKDYWMFFDHITPLDDRAMAEALEISGFKIVECRPKFLPFTIKSAYPKSIVLLKIYLRSIILQKLFGKQAFIEAIKV